MQSKWEHGDIESRSFFVWLSKTLQEIGGELNYYTEHDQIQPAELLKLYLEWSEYYRQSMHLAK